MFQSLDITVKMDDTAPPLPILMSVMNVEKEKDSFQWLATENTPCRRHNRTKGKRGRARVGAQLATSHVEKRKLQQNPKN